MLRASVLCAVACALLLGSEARAQETVPAQECCLDILFPISARAIGMGQTLVARSGIDGVFYNPATIIDLKKTTFIVNHYSFEQSIEVGTAPAQVNSFGLMYPTKSAGVFGLTYQSIDYGTDVSTGDNNETIGETSQLTSVLIATFATPIALGWSGGLSYHMYNFTVTCTGIQCPSNKDGGTTHMIDMGVRYEPRFLQNLKLGGSLMYFGPRLQVRNADQADVSPTRLRVGGAYNVTHVFTRDTTIEAWLHVDAVQRVHDASAPGINVGAEVIFDKTIFLRAGHAAEAGGASQGGSGVGLGLVYQRFEINVAKSLSTQIFASEPFYVSFGVTF